MHNVHIPVGIAAVIIGLLHGLLAGNVAGVKLSDAYIGAVFFSLNWGTACFVVLVLHILEVGIQLPSHLFAKGDSPTLEKGEKENKEDRNGEITAVFGSLQNKV